MSTKLSNYVIYNNWEKLDEDFSLINEKNLSNLVEKAVKYHSKECFDILIKHPNIREWISKYPKKISYIFENFVNAPNYLNEYYVNNILPYIAVLNYKSIEHIINNHLLFSKIFTKLKNDENTIKHLFIQLITSNNIDSYKYIYNSIKSNPLNFSFFNNNWINSNILFVCLEQDKLEILKELEKDNQNLSTVNIGFTQIPSLIISLLNRNINWGYKRMYNFKHEKKFECFEYLLSKNINTEHNLLWSTILDIDNSSYCLIDYFPLNIDWPFNFTKFSNDNINLIQQVHTILNPQNLLIILEQNNNLNNSYNFYMWRQILDLIYYLIKTVNSIPQIKNYINNINNIPNFDIIEALCINIFKSIKEIENPIRTTYRNGRHKWRRRQKNIKSHYLLRALQTIKYFKENKLSAFNPLTMINNYIEIKSKSILKQIIIYLIKLDYTVSQDFKTNVISKVFTKKEIKEFDKTIKKSKLDNIYKTIKKNISEMKQSVRITRKSRIVVIPEIDSENIVNSNEIIV
jgi:hypothetical protein